MKKLIISCILCFAMVMVPIMGHTQVPPPPPKPKCIVIGVLVIIAGVYICYKLYQWSNRLPLPPPPVTPPPPPVVPPPAKTNTATTVWPDEPDPPILRFEMYYIVAFTNEVLDANSTTKAPVPFVQYIVGEIPQLQSSTNMVDWLPWTFEEWDSVNGQLLIKYDGFGHGVVTNYIENFNGTYTDLPLIFQNNCGLPMEFHRLAREK